MQPPTGLQTTKVLVFEKIESKKNGHNKNGYGNASTKTTKAVAQTSSTNQAIMAGKQVYRQCQACHQLKKEVNGVGPHLVNLFGRPAGSLPGFGYSSAIQESGIVWNREKLTAFLSKPQTAIPGNRMPYAGIGNATDLDN